MKNQILVCLGIIIITSPAVMQATVWYVHPDSTLNCIQTCLNSCATGDTVLVGSGIYYENIVWPNTQGIDLVSENGYATTIIDGGGVNIVIGISVALDTSTRIQGFTIRNGYALAGAGIRCANNSSPTIFYNYITENTSDSAGAGISCAYNSSPCIDSNTIINNTSHYTAAGILCYINSNPTIENNLISSNHADFGSAGIGCGSYSSPYIINNTITDNTGGYMFGGIGCGNTCSPTIEDNTITYNTAQFGAGIGLESYGIIKHNTIIHNTADSMGGGIASYTSSSCIIDSNDISYNTAFKGGGIWVHEYSTPQIRYNTINDNIAYSGAGIRCSNYSFPNISNNIIQNNNADSAGGGITCVYGSSPVIDSNTIQGNNVVFPGGAGIFCMANSSPQITNNNICYNTVSGGAGGGICCYDSCAPVIKGNSITNNTAVRAGAIYLTSSCSGTIKFNTITDNNSPGYGCGIDCDTNCTPLIDSCTIANNNGIGISCFNYANPVIHYANIYNNSDYELYNGSPGITINAESNWWGNSSGPPVGSIYGQVDYDPWLNDSVVWQTGLNEQCSHQAIQITLHVFPNPFKNTISIKYSTHDPIYTIQNTTLKIFDATGRLVKEMNQNNFGSSGASISWDGRDNCNRELPCGTYFLELNANGSRITEKLLLIR